MNQKTHRIDQINSLIKQKFSEILMEEVELPDNAMITITKVKTSKDLRHAKIGISIYPPDKTDALFGYLCRHLKSLKFALHQRLSLKFSPEIKLYNDKTEQEAHKMNALLDNIKQKYENE